MNKRILLWSLFLIAAICINAQTKDLAVFHAINTASGIQVELKKGTTPKAEYTILKGRAEDLLIEVVDEILTVKYKSKKGRWNRTHTKAKVVVFYTYLSSITCSSGSILSCDEMIVADDMEIAISSGSRCNIKLQSKDVKISSSSGSNISIEGSADLAKFSASSGSKISASYFMVNNAEANVSSGANISLNASRNLKADASSGGSIKYKGKPESINLDSGMTGSISSY